MEQVLHTVLPRTTFRDTLAVLVLLLSLPPSLSALALGAYVFFAVSIGSSTVIALLSRLLRGHSSDSDLSVTPTVSAREKKKDKDTEDKAPPTSSPLLLIALFDVFVCIALHFIGPWLTRGIFVLAKALVAASVSGDRLLRVLLATGVIACSELIFSTSVGYLETQLGVRISQGQQLFPHLSPHYSISYGPNCLAAAVNWANLLLAVHVVHVAFASVFRTNLLSKGLNQLSSNHDLPPPFAHLRVKDHTQTETRVIQLELTPEQANTKLILEQDSREGSFEDQQTPAAYVESEATSDPVSIDNVVSQNFEVFCTTPAKIKNRQPIWALFAAVRAMATRKDIYSGGRPADFDENNALILSDYVNNYDDYTFANFDESGIRKERIRIFIDYVGETLISFQLQNYRVGDIFVRVNGLIWYQVSRGTYDGDTYFIVGGLTPLSQYDIQFIIEEEDSQGVKRKHLLDDLIVSTVDKCGETIPAAQTSGANNKVLSPLVTLQESLITTNDNLAKERVKLKKQRKEISKKLSSLKSEIEQLKSKIASSDRNDEKNYNKVLTLRVSVKQAESDVAKVEQNTAAIESQLNEVSEIHMAEKRRFDQLFRSYQQQKSAYQSKIDTKRNKLSELNVELDTLETKREKLSAKLEKLKAEVEKLNNDIESLLQADIDKRLKERKGRLEKRSNLLEEFTKEIKRLETGCLRLQQENENLKSQMNS